MAKISVITTAYNHEDTLQRAIISVRMQKNVEIEHIIIDDTDTKNGMMATFAEAFRGCTGEYIAFCDGDDYWLDENKLSKQLKYMKANPDCGLCVTYAFIETGGRLVKGKRACEITYDKLLCGKANIHAQTYLLRKSVFDKYIDFEMFVKKFNTWDYPIVLELIKHSRIHCLPIYTAVYNKNEESVTNTRDRIKRIKYIYGSFKIKWYYIKKYGCKFSTALYLIYRIIRHIYSIGAKRWT